MRPNSLEEYVGQHHVLGKDKILRQLLVKKDIPSMILWGPPGCGKVSSRVWMTYSIMSIGILL